MTPEQLPRWKDCRTTTCAGTSTALERFIYNHEPADDDKEECFRRQLVDLISDAESAAVRRHLEAEGPKPNKRTESDERLDELERRLDTMSRALAGVEAMNRRLLELERMHGLTLARAHYADVTRDKAH